MKYRPEISGLRAVAVLPVIFFHAGFNIFSGGFIGVDIFFVISGFLITTIIIRESENETFTLKKFYLRRARRILPALIFIVLCCIPLSLILMPPALLKDFALSNISIPFFLSNVFFWRTTGYWENPADLKPLLHTWSLSVEEQFYLLFPIVFLISWKVKKYFTLFLTSFFFFTSLLLAEFLVHKLPSATFFLLPTRLWELLLGSLLAMIIFYNKEINRNKILNEIFSLVGLLLVVFSIFMFDETTPVPGFYALYPTLGTMLILGFSEKTFTSRILSIKPLVGIGLISYSAYLWHQPFFAFLRLKNFEDPNELQLTLAIVLILFFSYLSWKFIENKFRDNNFIGNTGVVKLMISFFILILIFGSLGYYTDGYKQRFSQKYINLFIPEVNNELACLEKLIKMGAIFAHKGRDYFNCDNKVKIGSEFVNSDLVFIGDSHNNQLRDALDDKLKSINKSAIQILSVGCLPFIFEEVFQNKNCKYYAENLHKFIAENENIKKVVISVNWSGWVGIYNDTNVRKINDGIVKISKGFKNTINFLNSHGIETIIIKGIPTYSVNVPNYLAKRYFSNLEVELPSNIAQTRKKLNVKHAPVERLMSLISKNQNIRFVDVTDNFCAEEQCIYLSDDGKILYSDDHHLTYSGAKIIVNKLF